MKKILKLAAIACAAVLFVSCGAKDDTTQVKEVVEAYIKASASFDYGKLKSIVTPESVPVLEQAEAMMKDIPEEYKKMAEEAAKSVTFNAESINVNGDVATASISTMGMEAPIALRKVDGNWLIDMGGAGAAIEDVSFTEEEETEEGEDTATEEANKED